MLKRILPMVAILATTCILAVPSTASAWNRCGGQVSNWSQLYNNWKKQGILGSPNLKKVLVPAGYRPVDGSIKQFMRDRVMIGRTRTTVTIDNFGCAGGQLGSVGGKSLTAFWPIAYALPAKYSKKDVSKTPRKGYKPVRIRAHLVAQATCSNPGKKVITVTIFVKVSKTPKKPKAKTPPAPQTPASPGIFCPVGTNPVMTNSGLACQANSANVDQTAKAENDCKGPNINSVQCPITIIQNTTIIQVNAVCSKVIITYGDGSQSVVYKDVDNNTVTENYCSSQTTTPPPPPPPTDHPPVIECPTPPHVYVGGSVYVYCRASDPDGDLMAVTLHGDGYALASNTVTSLVMYDNSACPINWTCYRTQFWGVMAGTSRSNAKVTANGKSDSFDFDILVKPDDFGSY